MDALRQHTEILMTMIIVKQNIMIRRCLSVLYQPVPQQWKLTAVS